MSERLEKIKVKLIESRAALDAVLAQVGDRWHTPVYDDGEQWDVRQVVVHLADANRGVFANIQRIARGEGSSIPEGFDVDRYNQRVKAKMDAMTIEEARASLAETSAGLAAWLETLDDAQLDIEGRHPALDMQPVGKFLRIMALHELGHASDIARALQLHSDVTNSDVTNG